MSFFDLFRILFATHFLLGIPLALRLLRFLIFNPFISALLTPNLSTADTIVCVSLGTLILIWYFVWCGSIVFALSRRFPLVSIRVFTVVLAIVYAGFGCFIVFHPQLGVQRTADNPFFAPVIGTMLVIAIGGFLFLPVLKDASDAEEQRILERRDRRLDDLHPWGSDTSGSQSKTDD
jgi:hypothetical protein